MINEMNRAMFEELKACQNRYYEVPAGIAVGALGYTLAGNALLAAPFVALAAKKALSNLLIEKSGFKDFGEVILLETLSTALISALALMILTQAPVILTFTLGTVVIHSCTSLIIAGYQGAMTIELPFVLDLALNNDFSFLQPMSYLEQHQKFIESEFTNWEDFKREFYTAKEVMEFFLKSVTFLTLAYELMGQDLYGELSSYRGILEKYGNFESEVIQKPYDEEQFRIRWAAFTELPGTCLNPPKRTLKDLVKEMMELSGMKDAFLQGLASGNRSAKDKARLNLLFHPDRYNGPNKEKISSLLGECNNFFE